MCKLLTGAVAVLVIVVGCASVGTEKKSDLISITETSAVDFKPVEFNSISGLADYSYNAQKLQAEWINCRVANPVATIIVMHRDRAGFDKARFCAGWIAQTFMSEKIDVITVNRPGFAGSTGKSDFAGPVSMAALEAGIMEALSQGKNPKAATGIWGYSSGATAAALLSKNIKGLKFLILGGGIYDLEETLTTTTDSYIKAEIDAILRTGGDEALENRSIAYDVDGLPKRIFLYHGKQDTSVYPGLAEIFRDTLASSEYHVDLQVLNGVSHEIPWVHHRKILKVLAHANLPRK